MEPYRKALDDQFQNIQAAVHAAIVALTPVSQLIAERGNEDKKLNDAGKPFFDGLQLMASSFNAITTKRRELLTPKLRKELASRMINAELSPDFLFGPNVTDKIRKRKSWLPNCWTHLLQPEVGGTLL